MALIEIKVPDIGDFADVEVIEVLVAEGDTIKAEQSLVTVESDKASMEIPSSQGGTVKELKVKLGDKISEGSVLLMLEAEAEAEADGDDDKAAAPAPEPAPAPAAAPAPAPATGGGTVEVKVPDIGDFADVGVIEVLVSVGDSVEEEQSLITVESDKASMEIPSSAAGKVKALKVKLGDTVNVGDVIVVLEGASSAAAPAPSPAPAPAAAPQSASTPAPAPAPSAPAPAPAPAAAPHAPGGSPRGLPHASPSVRRFARELGVPLEQVKGSGRKGRITREDVQAFTRSVMAGQASVAGGGASLGGLELLPWPKIDFEKFGAIDRKPLSRIKKISGANLARNWVMIPHVTNNDEADITELEAFRKSTNADNKKRGLDVKVTMLAFVIKAVVSALKEYPVFNASLDGDDLVYKHYFNIGFAADTPNGLVVPVLKDADQKGVLQISQEMGEMAAKARAGKLGPSDMQGGCFTISSLGGIGGTHFTPIINAPEVAILGLSRNKMQPVWDGQQFVPRMMLPLSLSYDHRVIDGAAAARFNAYLGGLLSDFRRVLL